MSPPYGLVPDALADAPRVQLLMTESLQPEELVFLWNRIALTAQEGLVLEALRYLDPRIERIASVSLSRHHSSSARGGFIVKMRGSDQPIPIGSMGDGMWRMLAMAISLIRCRDGFLLIDEIDTGLHYTVMSNMWKLVSRVAADLNVQVFATTHSQDCVRSLATICRADVTTNSQVTIQRIEPDRHEAVPFSEAEIRVAAERNIEVR